MDIDQTSLVSFVVFQNVFHICYFKYDSSIVVRHPRILPIFFNNTFSNIYRLIADTLVSADDVRTLFTGSKENVETKAI